MQSGIRSMALGDIFENIFKLTGKTILRNLIVSLILLLPGIIVFTIGVDYFFSSLTELNSIEDQNTVMHDETVFQFMGVFFTYGISTLVLIISTLLGTLAVTIIGVKQFAGENISWQEAIKETFSIKFWRSLGISIVQVFVFGAIFMIPFIILIITIASDKAFIIFFGVLFFIAAFCAIIFLAIKWSFAIPSLAFENTTVVDSLKRSWVLVNNYWWRTFGILILLNILVQFALSIVTTPISFAVMFDLFADMFSSMDFENNVQQDPELMLSTFSGFGIRMGVVMGISSLLSLLITPLISVVMYFDLRAKHNEFADPNPEITEVKEATNNNLDIFTQDDLD